MFKKFDRLRSGHLNKHQFNDLLRKFQIELNTNDFDLFFCEIDRNQNGLISFEELYQAVIADSLEN